jgi:D-amino peptidase
MKIYISVDLEGVCGATSWDEVTRGKSEYPEFQRQMTREVQAACEGAFDAGAAEIVINDAHDTACNIIAEDLPENTQLIRGWSRHPYMMMQELDESFDGVLMLGYHSLAGSDGSPLAHTMSTGVSSLTINEGEASEFLINYYTAMLEKVPVLFISGDRDICDHAAEIAPGISTVSVKTGTGASTINIHPGSALKRIKSTVHQALSGTLSGGVEPLPELFKISVCFNNHQDAYKASFYPGCKLISSREVGFVSDNYFEVLRLFLFIF